MPVLGSLAIIFLKRKAIYKSNRSSCCCFFFLKFCFQVIFDSWWLPPWSFLGRHLVSQWLLRAENKWPKINQMALCLRWDRHLQIKYMTQPLNSNWYIPEKKSSLVSPLYARWLWKIQEQRLWNTGNLFIALKHSKSRKSPHYVCSFHHKEQL